MTDNEIKDQSLLRCVVKKSWQVSKRIGKVVGVGAVIVAIFYALFISWQRIVDTVTPPINVFLQFVSGIAAIFASVPLWVYGIATIPIGIIVYSWAWCVARDLIDEDWQSDLAENFALALALALALAALAAIIAAIAAIIAALAAIIAALAALAAIIAIAEPSSVWWYYVFRFIGAYIHYRRRIKE